mmetsp:Transcript_74492/g.125506  ORF Transcript_74492/g.125506 Transcript_74492/m.125506 type:complete len:226 (+) Transcript_74492:3675-4352(+)
MHGCDGNVQTLHVNVLAVNWRANFVTQDDNMLPSRFLCFGDKDTIFACRLHVQQALDVFRVLLVGFRIPEDHTILRPLHFGEGIDKTLVEVSPFIIRPHVGKIDERVNCQGNAETSALPTNRGNATSRNFEGAQMLPGWAVKLHHPDVLLLPSCSGCCLYPSDSERRPLRVPLHVGGPHTRVDQSGLLVHLRPHDLTSTIFKTNGQSGILRVAKTFVPVVPMEPY